MQKDLDSLEPKDRLKILLELASYTTPKMRSVDIQNEFDDNNELLNKLLEIPEENFNRIYE